MENNKVKYVCLNCAYVQSVKVTNPECTQCRSRHLVPYDKGRIIEEHLRLVNLAGKLQYLIENPGHRGPYPIAISHTDLKDLLRNIALASNEYVMKHEMPPIDGEAIYLYKKLLTLYYSGFNMEIEEATKQLLESDELPDPIKSKWKQDILKTGERKWFKREVFEQYHNTK